MPNAVLCVVACAQNGFRPFNAGHGYEVYVPVGKRKPRQAKKDFSTVGSPRPC